MNNCYYPGRSETARQNRKCTRVKWISVMVRCAYRGNTHWRCQRECVPRINSRREERSAANGEKVDKKIPSYAPRLYARSHRCEMQFSYSSDLAKHRANVKLSKLTSLSDLKVNENQRTFVWSKIQILWQNFVTLTIASQTVTFQCSIFRFPNWVGFVIKWFDFLLPIMIYVYNSIHASPCIRFTRGATRCLDSL